MFRCPAKMLRDGGFGVGGHGQGNMGPDGGDGEILGGEVRGERGEEEIDIAQALRGGVREGGGLIDGGDAGLLEREGGR